MNKPTPMQAAVSAAREFEAHKASFELAHLARALIIGAGRRSDAAQIAEELRAPDRVRRILKAGVPAGGEGLSGDYRAVSSAFLAALRNAGALEAVLANARIVPPKVFVSATTIAATFSETGEGKGKAVSRIELTPASLVARKGTAIIVLSSETLREGGSAGLDFVNDELRRGVVAASDDIFLDAALDGVTPLSGSASVADDLKALLDATNLSAMSRLVLIVPPKGINALVLQQNPAAGSALTTNGGTFAGLRVAVTDALPPGTVVMIDASGVVAADEGLTLDTATHASLQMDDATTQAADSPPTPTTMTSLWQTNSVALRAERNFRFVIPRASAVAVMTGSTWAGTP